MKTCVTHTHTNTNKMQSVVTTNLSDTDDDSYSCASSDASSETKPFTDAERDAMVTAMKATDSSSSSPAEEPRETPVLKRKSHEAPRKATGQRKWFLSGDEGAKTMTVTASNAKQAAIKLFNKRMRQASFRRQLKDMFAKTRRAQKHYDWAAQTIPSELEAHLQHMHDVKVPQVVAEGRRLVAKHGPSTRVRGVGMYKQLMQLAGCEVGGEGSEAEEVAAAQEEFRKCAEVYTSAFWKALKSEEDDRFYFGPFMAVEVNDGHGCHGVFMCSYTRKTKPSMLDVLKRITFQANATPVKDADSALMSSITGGLTHGSEADPRVRSAIQRLLKP